jgi:hypothetical protein
MSQMSNYLENKLVDHSLGTTTYTKPTNVYLALYTTNPTDADSGTEVSGSGYARQVLAFTAGSNGVSSNSASVTFTASGGSFGTVAYVGIRDALTTGNLLYYGAMTTSRTISDGESLVFDIGSIVVTLA